MKKCCMLFEKLGDYKESEDLSNLCLKYLPLCNRWKCIYSHQFWGGENHDISTYDMSVEAVITSVDIDGNGFQGKAYKWCVDGVLNKTADRRSKHWQITKEIRKEPSFIELYGVWQTI